MPSHFMSLSLFTTITLHCIRSALAITCPNDITIESGSSSSFDITGIAQCSPDHDLCYSQNIQKSAKAGCEDIERTIYRDWTCTDTSSTTQSNCHQTIEVKDSIPPTLTCPATKLSYRLDVPTDPATTSVTCKDNMGYTSIEFDGSTDTILSTNDPCKDTIYKMDWGCHDCSNTRYCQPDLTIEAADPPQMKVIHSGEDTSYLSKNDASATVPEPTCTEHQYFNDISLSHQSEVILEGDRCNKEEYKWICTDDCGRDSEPWIHTVYRCTEGLIDRDETVISWDSVWNSPGECDTPTFSDVAWCCGSNDDHNSYIQADLGASYNIDAVSTKGRRTTQQWVTKYALLYSSTDDDDDSFAHYGILVGNSDSNTAVKHSVEFVARYLRFIPTAHYGHKSMRIEAYGTGLNPVGEESIWTETPEQCCREFYEDLFDIGDEIYLKPEGCDDACLNMDKPSLYKAARVGLNACSHSRSRWRIIDLQIVGGVKQVKILNDYKVVGSSKSSYWGLYNSGGILKCGERAEEWFSVQSTWDPDSGRYWINLRNENQCPYWDDCSDTSVTMQNCDENVYKISVDFVSGGNSMVEYLDWNGSVRYRSPVVSFGFILTLICVCVCVCIVIGVFIKQIIGVNKKQGVKYRDVTIESEDDLTQSEEELNI